MEQQPLMEHRSESRHSVELRAYTLWEQRGCPWGTPEFDWFRAERELRTANQSHDATATQDAASDSLTVTTAKIVGAVLGSVTGVVAAVSNSLTSD